MRFRRRDAFVRIGLLLILLTGSGRESAAYESDDPAVGPGPEASWRADAQWDAVDEKSTADIHRYTTDPAYLTPLVSYVPEHASVPSPRDVLGYTIGTEGVLTRPEDEVRYFEALAAASPRVRLLEMGGTDEDRTMVLVVIADAATLEALDTYKGYTALLADPRTTDEARAREIASVARPIVHITAGLHSPETGPPEMVMELAYRLAVSDHPKIEEIRQNVITLITPITEVDGRARVVDWYYRYLTEYDDRRAMPSRSPPYWGHYVYHDNNRDGVQVSQRLTQNYFDAFFEWHPTYSLDLHESVPLLYVSGGTGPYNPSLDPITISEWQWFASYELTELNKHGLPGVWTWGYYTGWNPGYLLWVTNNHNSMGRFYETFGNSSARTMERDLGTRRFAGKEITSRQWYRSSPPPRKLRWSLRNNTNYMQSGVLASLSLVARNGEELLYNFWRKGANGLRAGRAEPPHAWVVPRAGQDPLRLAHLVNQLLKQRVEVHRATTDFEIDEKAFSAGDYVVRLDQPYGRLARNLLAPTKFPKDADHAPYDDVTWTLGLVYRVDTEQIDDPEILELEGLERVEDRVALEGHVESGAPAGWAVANHGQSGLVRARYALDGVEVLAAEQPFKVGDAEFPVGSWIVPRRRGVEQKLERVAGQTGLEWVALDERPEVPTHELDLPRLALYHNWVSTQADGWVRYTLERDGVPYAYINDDDVRKGKLRKRFDVIVMAHQGRASLKAMIHGRDPKYGPMAYTKTAAYPSHGRIDSSRDITGGIGFAGLANLERFLDDGGTLLLLGSAGRLASDAGLLRNVRSSTGGAVNTPGSVLRVKVMRPDHPIAYGYTEVNHLFRTNGPLYTVPEHYEHWIVVQYGTEKRPDDEKDGAQEEDEEKDEETPKKKPLLISGLVKGEKDLSRKAAILDVPRHSGGRVVLYSFNPMHRYLNHGDFAYLYNAILHWNDFPAPEPILDPSLALD